MNSKNSMCSTILNIPKTRMANPMSEICDKNQFTGEKGFNLRKCKQELLKSYLRIFEIKPKKLEQFCLNIHSDYAETFMKKPKLHI